MGYCFEFWVAVISNEKPEFCLPIFALSVFKTTLIFLTVIYEFISMVTDMLLEIGSALNVPCEDEILISLVSTASEK